jgi:uncharacterized membrane protein YhaH (DUF805 family)
MKSANPQAVALDDYGWEVAEETERDSWLNRNFLWLLFSFQGRIPRLAYWAASTIVVIAYCGGQLAATRFVKDTQSLQIISGLMSLPLLWTSLAIQIKRWHDRDKSGWWFFICLIPIIGGIWSFIELGCLRGTYGPNSYGTET